MLNKLTSRASRSKKKSGTRQTWIVTERSKLALVFQAGHLERSWPKKGIREGAVARVLCTEKEPVYFHHSSTTGVLRIQFMREATTETGELLLPTSICAIDIQSGESGLLPAPQDDSDSDGVLVR